MNLLSANSTMRFVEPKGFDYYWVPANLHIIHIDYPYDFILYALALIGLWWVVHRVYLLVLNMWRKG
ncbi:MAG: hypothetical protein M0Q91_17510 [Methanoregula sp.]|jgi:hypothetical protein|nr:hypothetical protein [Methanoregula sp.]